MDPRDEATRCRDLHRALLTMLRSEYATARPCVFLRELARTAPCDRFLDLSAARAEHEAAVGADGMRRVEAFEETERDARRAAQAVLHCRPLTEAELARGATAPRCWLRGLFW